LKNLVTGGAGFIGSHIIEKLISYGEEVICLDNFETSSINNIQKWFSHPNFELIKHNVVKPIDINVNRIWHLACPASPTHYIDDPINTMNISFNGSLNMLNLAKKYKSTILLASSSEIYGDGTNHPQIESFNGEVNTISSRSCYVEGKRIAETLFFDFFRTYGVDIKIARIFNAYGPNMLPNDGRVISNFICQALKNENLSIYGNGKQTRSFCYIDDLVDGLTKFMNSKEKGPINFGNDKEEYTINDLAYLIREKINPLIKFEKHPLPEDDHFKRKPIISLAKKSLEWEPKINLIDGLEITIQYFKKKLHA
tara:strand:+ start:4295 stop:5227 length:933 start_codon:yes stop_codon:yes gene_type:complete